MSGNVLIQYVILLSLRKSIIGFQLNVLLPSDPSYTEKCQDIQALLANTSEYDRVPSDNTSVLNSTSLGQSSKCTYNLTNGVISPQLDTSNANISEVYIRKKRALSLTCNIRSWQKPISIFGPGMAELEYVTFEGSEVSIKLVNVQTVHEGLYVCLDAESNILGTWNVSVLGSLIVNISSTSTCNYYENHILTCRTSENLHFETWEHRRGNITLRTLPGEDTEKESILEISTCGYQDTGEYVCRIKDITGEVVEKEIAFSVYAPPVITNEASTIEEKMAAILVQLYSVPFPLSVQWMKDGHMLRGGHKYQMRNLSSNVDLKVFRKLVNTKGFLVILNITDPSANDFGPYTLHVENKYGKTATTIELTNPHTDYATYIYIGLGTLAVLLVILVLVVIVMKYFKWPAKKESNKIVQCVSLEDLLDAQKSKSEHAKPEKDRKKKKKV